MIRAILTKLIFGLDAAQVQADLRNLEALKLVANQRIASLEERLIDIELNKATSSVVSFNNGQSQRRMNGLEDRLNKLEATLLPAVKTGEANLGELPAFNGNHATESNVFATLSVNIDPTETVGFVDDLRDQVMNGKITPNQAREALGKAPMPKVEGKVTKARKPRAPKGGQ